MIKTVRTWTLPKRRFFVGVDKELTGKPAKVKQPKRGFFDEFLKLWETQADIIIRNMER